MGKTQRKIEVLREKRIVIGGTFFEVVYAKDKLDEYKRWLGELGVPGVGCYHFDTIGIPSAAEISARFGSGEAFQAWALDEWISRLARNDDRVAVAVLDASVRPRAARDALARHGIARGAVVLVDCAYAERNARLRGPRGQPELATA